MRFTLIFTFEDMFIIQKPPIFASSITILFFTLKLLSLIDDKTDWDSQSWSFESLNLVLPPTTFDTLEIFEFNCNLLTCIWASIFYSPMRCKEGTITNSWSRCDFWDVEGFGFRGIDLNKLKNKKEVSGLISNL